MTPLETAFDQLQEASFWSYGWGAMAFFVVFTIVAAVVVQQGCGVVFSAYAGLMASLCTTVTIMTLFSPPDTEAAREAVRIATQEYAEEQLGAENVLILDHNFQKGYTMEIVYSDSNARMTRETLRYDAEHDEIVTITGRPLHELPSEDS